MRRPGLMGVVAVPLLVVALNSVPPSAGASAKVTRPGPPTVVQATSVDGVPGISVSWGAPVSDGGSPILYYVASSYNGKYYCTSPNPGPDTCRINGFRDGDVPHSIRVRAVNAAGSGQTTSVSPNAANTGCQPDPAAAIAALPAGGTFDGTGNCYTTLGIAIQQPGVTIDGGTYNDPTVATTGPVNTSINPIISVQAPNVTVKNVTLNGLGDGLYTNTDVGEEGIQVVSGGGTQNGVATTGVNLDNVTTNKTFGDGLILGFEPYQPPPSVTVNNYTINLAGRQGLTVAYGSGTFNNVTVNQGPIADTGVDFESDIDNFGPSNVIFNHLITNQGVLIQSLEGPATFNDSTISDNIGLIGDAATSGSQVTMNGGSLAIRNDWHGTPPAGIWVNGGGNLSFNNVAISRLPGALPTTEAWIAVNGANVIFNHSLGAMGPPLGTNDASSTVTVVP
jgi:hypothetical protein